MRSYQVEQDVLSSDLINYKADGRTHKRIQWEGQGADPLKNHKNVGFLSSTGPDPLKNHKAAKPAFNNGPSLARQRNAI